ncbi:MAG TPA: SAM-dependent methyltransferase [Vicinamibacterales bacterium]|jgi:methyltransferase (TIGR00027 family)
MSETLRTVSDTALWVAMYRALESDRPDALFHDPYARRLAGPRGEAILASIPRARSMAWPMIVRTAVMDEIVLRLVAQGVRTVVNLAAGLDVRAYRLALPASLHWLDVDLPGMIAYRREHLSDAVATCRHEDVDADLRNADARAAVFGRAGTGPGPGMVITEGLLVYLTPGQVGELARDVHAGPGICWWLIDLGSPLLLKMLSQSWQPSLDAANAPMQFAPAENTAFFEPFGWREAEYRSTWDESRRLKRSVPLAGLWELLGRLRSRATREEYKRLSGVVLLEHTDRATTGGPRLSSARAIEVNGVTPSER